MGKIINLILFITFVMSAESTIIGQNDGIRGYGSFEFVELDTYDGKAYTNGGGGVIINNNLILGGYVSTLTRPFRWDLFTVLSNPETALPQFTNNETATNSTITNFDIGGRIGFNIAPAKSLQTTLSIKIGYSTINYLESYLDEDIDLSSPDLETLPILLIDITHNNFNVAPQLDLQFKVGRAFKISVVLGYKFQPTKIRSEDVFPTLDNLLADSGLFSGTYLGLGFTFGNL